MPDRATIGDVSFDINDTVIEERCGQHDLITLKVASFPTLESWIGDPVLLDIHEGGNSRRIVGYYDTHGTSTGRSFDTVTAVFVLGASCVMRSGVERQWKDKRPFEIARDIVQPYAFCLEMDTLDYTIPLFTQGTESDWQTLARLANETGMSLIGTNCVIRMVDPQMEIRRRMMRPLTTFDIRTLYSHHYSNTPVPLGYERRVIQGIDSFGETFTVIANEDAPVSLPAPEIVKCLEDALNTKKRIERRKHTLRTAECMLTYWPVLRSGTTVGLTNGTNTMVWFVAEATHIRTVERSSTKLVLHRDEDAQWQTTAVWTGDQWPVPMLQNGKWVASTRWEREL